MSYKGGGALVLPVNLTSRRPKVKHNVAEVGRRHLRASVTLGPETKTEGSAGVLAAPGKKRMHSPKQRHEGDFDRRALVQQALQLGLRHPGLEQNDEC